ncbi:MAG: KpsF/GutQ family sugar-phosphate isomerase [Sedimentisphaerales bacterium]
MDELLTNIKTLKRKEKEIIAEIPVKEFSDKTITYAKEVFGIVVDALMAISQRLDKNFSEIIRAILSCPGRVIVCGMGKSGIIGRKIASTLSSTGTPSFFMHPAEAFHGDLGMLKSEDILLLISYSGETEEVLRIIPFLKENKNLIMSMTGNKNSTLAESSDFHLDVQIKNEACPFKIAPTTSATAALVMGDAIAIALMKERAFKAEDYAKLHPGGSLGRRLLTTVENAMIRKNLPIITEDSDMKDVIQVMTSSRLGMAVVLDKAQFVIGIITDGDLRRALNKYENIFAFKAKDIMTKHPKTIKKDLKLYEAEKLLSRHEINALIVVDDANRPLGVFIYHNI